MTADPGRAATEAAASILGVSVDVDDAARIVSRISEWFAAEARPLPWRAASVTPWGVLVSEFMLQQTQASRVEPKWIEFMERWPEPADLAAATDADVLRVWDRLGYPRRALWLRRCAVAIAEEHGGRVPATVAELETLPGIGPYTAAAVASFAHGVPAPVVDTNVRRVLARAFVGDPEQWSPNARRDRAVMSAVAPAAAGAANAWNAASMEFGALVCTAKRPACDTCIVAELCAWQRRGAPPALPHEKPRRQPRFEGSDRQMRGRIMRALRDAHGPRTRSELIVLAEAYTITVDASRPASAERPAPDRADAGRPIDERFDRSLTGLVADGLAREPSPGVYALP